MKRLFFLFALLAASAAATAQSYPAKPVKIIVPAQPGGGLDLVGRTIGDQLSRAMEQSFVIENAAGAGGSIAAMTVARAAPDGYTLMVGYVGTHGTNPAVRDRKSTRLNSSHTVISYAVFCLKKKNTWP